MDFKPQPQTFSLRLLLDCLAFLGLSATFGGIVLVVNPTGGLLGMPISLLRFSPFDDFLIPGLILGIVFGIVFGIGSFAAILALCIQDEITSLFGFEKLRCTARCYSRNREVISSQVLREGNALRA
jgi:hypothetical protein